MMTQVSQRIRPLFSKRPITFIIEGYTPNRRTREFLLKMYCFHELKLRQGKLLKNTNS